MTRLHDPPFIEFDGTPVTGRVPPLLRVMEGRQLTPQQYGGVSHAYKLFRNAVGTMVGDYLVQHRVLPDGTRVRMESMQGRDVVYVWPTGGVDSGFFRMFPAFWLNEPAHGAPAPATPEYGTWTNVPYANGKTLATKRTFWKAHPGNMTWRSTRAESKTAGIVLSWWGLSKSRYGADWACPVDAQQPKDYGKLFVNGTLVADFDGPDYPHSWPTAIIGACITLVGGAPTISVMTSRWGSQQDIDGQRSLFYRGYGLYGPQSGGARIGTAGCYGFVVPTITTYHARLPADFMDKGVIKPVPFTTVNSTTLSQWLVINNNGNQFWLHQVYMHLTAGMKINESGTEGVLDIFATTTGPIPSNGTGTAMVAVFLDPRTGAVSGWMSVDDPRAQMWAENNHSGHAFDYEGDELVVAAQRWQGDAATPNSVPRELFHSKYGVLMADPTAQASSDPPEALWRYDWSVFGDQRAGVTVFVGANWPGSTNTFTHQTIGWWNMAAHVFVKGALVRSVYKTFYISTNSWMLFFEGYEGADSSFDGRMAIIRFFAEVMIFADDADVTPTIPSAQDIRYPVLNGPMAWGNGSTARPKQYVYGEPP